MQNSHVAHAPLATRTSRLILDPIVPSDADDIMRVYADPATWRHAPAGRYSSLSDAEAMIERSRRSHHDLGLGTWAIRLASRLDQSLPVGAFVGTGGMLYYQELGVWNLGYRLTPRAWGRGLATELAREATSCAARVAPQIPVSARVLTSNPGSVRVLEKLGLRVLWEGESAEAPMDSSDAGPVRRRIYGDRELPSVALDWFVAHP